MASEGVVAKRAKLAVSRVHWSHMDLPESIAAKDQETHGSSRRDSVRKWLTTTVAVEDAKHEPQWEAADAPVEEPDSSEPHDCSELDGGSSRHVPALPIFAIPKGPQEPLRRNPSSDDDLALGVEASLYGNQGVRTVQEFLRWSRSSPALSRWNSFSSATSGRSGPLSVMDILSLWNDDPEEVLLDLGFGCDEPDLSGRIPARFINHQSQARGINLQVFLEAQKNRLDLENPDVSNRFRQLEVLQQVTTAFSSLVGSFSSPLREDQGKELPPEARERRRRMGMLFRRASKKSLSQIHNNKTQDVTTLAATSPPCTAPESLQPPSSLEDKRGLLKSGEPGPQEVAGLSPLAEEQGGGLDPQAHPQASMTAQEGALRHFPLREGQSLTAHMFLQRKKSPGQLKESFEMEEIHSFDESSVTGSYTGGAVNLVQGVMRTNSCQSDSSGFLEELFIPSLSQQASPGSNVIKALSGLSGGSTDSQSSERPGFPISHTPSSLTSTGVDKSLLSSPCPSPQHSLLLVPPLSPVSKSDPQISELEKPPDKGQSPPAPFVCKHPPPCSSSPELQNVTHLRSPTPPSLSSFTSLSPTSSAMELASLIGGSEEIKTEEKDAPSPRLSTLPHHSEDTAFSAFSPPASSASPSPNLDHLLSASVVTSPAQSDSSSGSPGNTQPEWTEVAPHDDDLSSPPPSPPCLPPYSSLYNHGSSPLVSPPLTESFSHSPENNQKDSLFPGTGLLNTIQEEETLSTLSSQLEKDSLFLDSKLKEGCATLACLSPVTSIPVCESALSSQSPAPDGLIDSAVRRIPDLTKQSISQQDRSFLHDGSTDSTPASAVQDVIHVKMDHLSLDSEYTLQVSGKGEVEGERHTDIMQTGEAVVYSSDTESSAALSEGSRLVSEDLCIQTEIDPPILPCNALELSTVTEPGELREACQMEMNGTESESPRCSLVLHDDFPEAQSTTEVEPKDLIKIDSLDLVFQTSVDGSDGENGDLDAFFQQLDTEGQVYWAEPIQVSNSTPVLGESGSREASDESPEKFMLPGGPALDLFSSTGRAVPLSSSTTVDPDQTSTNATVSSDPPSSSTLHPFPSSPTILKPSTCSVSVQMSSSPSSHIVQRKDVPYITDSKPILLPSLPTLDTSTPFRAVQSWTDLQIQRNALTKKLSHGPLHIVPNKVTVSMSALQTTQRPTLIFSSSPSVPLLCNDEQSHDCLPGVAREYHTGSVSVDKGLWPDEEQEVDRNEDEEKLWEGDQSATMACYYACDHQCTCCTEKSYNKQQTVANIPYSLDELEEMMLCLQQFCSVLSNMEEQLSEDQAAVYSSLSDQDREKVRDIKELRRAVKQEAAELEMQLNELAHHYDDSLKMKMHRLLDEQSLLCSQLRVFLPGVSPASNRTVSTQCCLLPQIPLADVQNSHIWSTWNVDSPRQSPPGSESVCEGLGCAPTKADKLDIVGFLQRLKDSLRHSVNTDSLE